MSLRKPRDVHATTNNQDNISRDEAMAKMTVKLDMLAAQMARKSELLDEYHRTLERKDKSSERFRQLILWASA